ncbi:unnamed protein product, partial [Phaeothamnion confervicola]
QDLAGLRVTHDAGAFGAGEAVVLTLKDAGVLEHDEHGVAVGLADSADELENAELAEADRLRRAKKQAARARQGAYTAYDDDEFDHDAAAGAAAATGTATAAAEGRPVLRQYDEEEIAARASKAAGVVLGAHGAVGATDGVGGAASMPAEGRRADGLKVESRTAAEYMTATEAAALFKKPKKFRKKLRRHMKDRGADGDDDGELSDGVAANGDVGASVHAYAGGNGIGGGGSSSSAGDHGSRAARTARANVKSAAAAVSMAEGKEKFARAKQRAAERAEETLRSAATATPAPSGPGAGGAAPEEFETDMLLSLERARRLAQLRERGRPRYDVGEEVLTSMVKFKREERGAAGASAAAAVVFVAPDANPEALLRTDGGDGMDVDGIGGGGTHARRSATSGGGPEGRSIVFTDTLEFSSRLQARLAERGREAEGQQERDRLLQERKDRARGERRAREGAAALILPGKAGDGAALAAAKDMENGGGEGPSIGAAPGGGDNEDATAEAERERADLEAGEAGDGEGGSDTSDDEQLGFVHKQPLAAAGMAGALKLLSQTGDLRDRSAPSGRARDQRMFPGEEEAEARRGLPAEPFMGPDGAPREVKLEYRDEFGRQLTRKEAFRQLNYRFHGYGPGKKRQDKRLKILEEERKRERASADLSTLGALQATQRATAQPYVLLSGSAAAVAGGGSSTGPPTGQLSLRKGSSNGK